MSYELWPKVSRSIMGTYFTENAALAAVREAVMAHGRVYSEGLAIIREDRLGRSRAFAEGKALVERALGPPTPRTRIHA